MTLGRPSFSSFLFLCSHVLLAAFHTTCDAAQSSHPVLQVNCSTSGNYTSTSTYAANLNQFLAALPEKAVPKNGGFFNGTVGEGPDTVYGLAMCSADYSRSDCGDCLAATASSDANGLPNLCPGSTTVLAWFEPCLVRYSDTNFFGTAEIGSIYTSDGPSAGAAGLQYSKDVQRNLKEATGGAVASPQRFGASSTDPYTLVQCTWDLSPDRCKQCLDVLSANASGEWTSMTVYGQRRSYSCAVRYSNSSFMVVPLGGAAVAPTPQSVEQATTSATQSSGATGKGSLTIGVVGSVLGVILLACLAGLIWYVRYGRNQPNTIGRAEKFTYQRLAAATRDFAVDRKLGEGAFGAVYKGTLMLRGREVDVAIKKNAHTTSDQAKAAFYKEVEIMSPLSHRNIIRLVGWCDERNSLLLVYELVDDRNLQARLYGHGARVDAELSGARAPGSALDLDWHKRYNILHGIASGLEYLHNNCAKAVMHRDIKPGNVMLDRDSNAKLCDFGLVTQLTHAITSRSTNNVIGTQGYMDPAYQSTGQVTKGSDVYSFGVLLLEVVCGVAPNLIGSPPKNSLIEKVRECCERNAILDAADQRLRGNFDEEIKGVLLIGLRCVETSRGDRPSIQIVLADLVSIAAKSTSHNRRTSAVVGAEV
ncbi:hypothetical protein CFC21_026923 [Triticum aestivum]|uniref:Uncharacterized protein n=2 Tax=Triticum aestivum TaxID=4565 RepID=A0A3B6CHS2_WHEAT|nr:cysteine-rich receptor-like protein kinase 6 [Triticum aestivum]KAF7012764.1 hypothetical protein CFC21_026923 [Triticum aestivum]